MMATESGAVSAVPPWIQAFALRMATVGIQAAVPADEARPHGASNWGLRLPDNPVPRRTACVLAFE